MAEEYQDRVAKCSRCGDEFTVAADEQRFLRERFGVEYVHPKRCRPCRQKAKAEKGGGVA